MPKERIPSTETQYGLYDTTDNVWLGNEEGPLRYDEKWIAEAAAMIADHAAGRALGRTRALPIDPGQGFRYRDSIDLIKTPLEALTELEAGCTSGEKAP